MPFRPSTQSQSGFKQRLIIADHIAIISATQVLIRRIVDVLAEEMNRTIDKQILRAARVHRLKGPTDVPLIRLIRTCGETNLIRSGPRTRGIVVDRSGGPGMETLTVLSPETSVSCMVVTRRNDFTHVNDVGSSVTDVFH